MVNDEIVCKHLRRIKGFDDLGTEREVCMFFFEDRGYAVAPCCLDSSSKEYIDPAECKGYTNEIAEEEDEDENREEEVENDNDAD